jgi:hypothetical protein
VYPTENAAGTGIVVAQPSALINDSCDRVPSYVLPAGADYRAFIASDTTDMGGVAFDPRSKESEKQQYAAAFTGNRWGWWPRIVHGAQVPVPVYDVHTTTPDYRCVADGVGVVENLAAAAFSTKARTCRAVYNGGYVDTTDADITHAPVRTGIQRMVAIGVDTTDSSVATAANTRHLADINRSSAPGTVTITVPIAAADGSLVDPCDIEAGRILQVDGTQNGTAIGRIILVRKTGLHTAEVTLEGTPLSPRNAIDRRIQG